jgi:hypothetical protein
VTTTTFTIPAEVAERGPRAISIYEQVIANGETERFAIMCACQQAPGSKNTDRAFSQGQVEKMQRMPKRTRDNIIRLAKSAGIQTDGKFYMGGLGGYTNPAAWVSSAEDVITSCKVQNKGVEGVLNYKVPRPQEPVPVQSKPLADELVGEMAQKEMQADPALAARVKKNPKARRELREKVIAKYGPKR